MIRDDGSAHVASPIPQVRDEEKPPRNPDVPCPSCGCKWLYTDYYDQCYECGRNIGNETNASRVCAIASELDSEEASSP
jgi:hypothetical protein